MTNLQKYINWKLKADTLYKNTLGKIKFEVIDENNIILAKVYSDIESFNIPDFVTGIYIWEHLSVNIN